jgi:hypothetical protein
MEHEEYKKAMLNLYREHSRIMQEYAASGREDETFEVKRKLLQRMRNIEKEIEKLQKEQTIFKIGKR